MVQEFMVPMTDLDIEIGKYRCPMGMVSNIPNPESRTWDNPALFTAQWINLRGVLGDHSPISYDVYEFVNGVLNSWTRWPLDGDKFTGGPPSHDELFAWALILPVGGLPGLVRDKSPGELRFIDLMPWLKALDGGKLTLWDKLAWSAVTVASVWSTYEDTSGKCKKWVQLRQMLDRNWMCNWAISYWQHAMTKKYPNGLQELFGIYFGYEHPLTVYAPRNFNLW